MTKRLIAALAVLLVWAGIVWFTAWDLPPSQWSGEARFTVAFIGIWFAGVAAMLPIYEED